MFFISSNLGIFCNLRVCSDKSALTIIGKVEFLDPFIEISPLKSALPPMINLSIIFF